MAYGNALEVLDKVNEYPNVQRFIFKYVRYDFISRQQCLAKLKNFCSLIQVTLDSNNLTSFVQLSKFESLNMLKTINVYNNDVSETVLLRSYIVYRFPNITTINDSTVTEEDRSHARQQFQNFDKTLCKSLYKTGDSGKKYADFSVDFVNSTIIPHATRINEKLDTVVNMWDMMVYDTIKQTLAEGESGINEIILESLLNSPAIM